MHLFMTGATGYVGSIVTSKALLHGHSVTAIARSEASAAKLESMGVTVFRGSFEDLDVLAEGASNADVVLHLGFIHEFNRPYNELVRIDQEAIRALGSGLVARSGRFVGTSTTTVVEPNDYGSETDESSPLAANPTLRMRVSSEELVASLQQDGISTAVLRLPPYVYGQSVFVPALLRSASAFGISPYVGSGKAKTSAVFVEDLADLYLAAAEQDSAQGIFNATTESDVEIKQLAEAIGQAVGVPARSMTRQEADSICGPFIAMFLDIPNRASNVRARKRLGWNPHPATELLEDITRGSYRELAQSVHR